MSHEFTTRTFTVSRDEIPERIASLEAATTFRQGAGARASARSEGLHFVSGSTRSGWAIYVMRALLTADPHATSLQFLTDSGHAYTFETEFGTTGLSVLGAAEVDAAAEQLVALLASLRADPMRVCDADEEGISSVDEVGAALGREYVCASPAFDRQVGGDDGQGADYLFTWLRSVLAVLRAARGQRLSVVHVLEM